MGKLFKRRLDHPSAVFCCKRCGTHLCDASKVISNSFHGRCGRACLVSGVINVYFMRAEERTLMTGLHSVRDVHCVQCHENVGWTYDFAHDDDQRYKIEKFVLERELLVLSKQYSIDERFSVTGEEEEGGVTGRATGRHELGITGGRSGAPSGAAGGVVSRLAPFAVLQRLRNSMLGRRRESADPGRGAGSGGPQGRGEGSSRSASASS